jgi:DNA-binding transcriptional MerR regulator
LENKYSESAYLSTTEFSLHTGINVSTLHYYDRLGLFSPAAYGSGVKSKHRYYSPEQITTVKMIRVLRAMGVQLERIKELMSARTPEKIIWLIRRHQNELDGRMHNLHEARSLMDAVGDLLIEAVSITETDLEVAVIPAKKIVMGAENEYGGAGFHDALTRFRTAAHRPKLNAHYPIGGYFESMEVFLREPSRPTRFFSLDPSGYEETAKGLYLIGYTRGYYGQTNDLPVRMAVFAEKNGLAFSGPVYNVYLSNEISEVETGRYLLRASATVTETSRKRPRKEARDQ